MNAKEIQKKQRQYNKLYNEGCEGYDPYLEDGSYPTKKTGVNVYYLQQTLHNMQELLAQDPKTFLVPRTEKQTDEIKIKIAILQNQIDNATK